MGVGAGVLVDNWRRRPSKQFFSPSGKKKKKKQYRPNQAHVRTDVTYEGHQLEAPH